jgi:hypothetical protein
MVRNRREFLRGSSATASLLPFLPVALGNEASAKLTTMRAGELVSAFQQQDPEELVDPATLRFWTEEVRRGGQAAFARNVADNPAQPEFVYFDRDDGFTPAAAMDEGDFPDRGDCQVLLRVEAFRPSEADRNTFDNLETGTLRIDMTQRDPLPGLLEALAWSAMAVFHPDENGNLPETVEMQFDPGTTWGRLEQIPLPNGAGFWCWNFFFKERQGFWGRFVDIFRDANPIVTSLLGLPAISVLALQAVDRFVGHVQGQSEWLFQSPETPVFATRDGLQRIAGNAVGLREGDYLVIPRRSLRRFGDARNQLKMMQGLLVPADLDDPFAVHEAAAETLSDLTYLSVRVRVNVAEGQPLAARVPLS